MQRLTTAAHARAAIGLALAALLTAPALAGGSIKAPDFDGPGLARDLSGRDAPKPDLDPASERLGVDLRDVPGIVLDPVDVAALLAEDDAQAEWGARSLRTSAAIYELIRLQDGLWQDAPGGRLWAVDLTAPGAYGLRLHLTGVNMPSGAYLHAYAPGETIELPFGPVSDFGPGQRGEGWTPVIPGETVRVEYYVPDAARGGNARVPFAIDEIQHVYRDLFNRDENASRGAGGCHNDPACFPTWDDVSDSVALVSYQSGGFGFVCSGQLINTISEDLTPYFLIANHCINSASEAASASFRFRNQRLTCGGGISSGSVASGADLVSTWASSDSTLLLIDGELPSYVTWSGWLTFRPNGNEPSTCIHHPSGSYKRISFGLMGLTPNCGGPGTNFVLGNWIDGVTEGGSSGSGFWRDSDQRLFGVLTCGASACSAQFADDSYGRFDRAYTFAFDDHLGSGTDDGLEDNDDCANAVSLGEGVQSNLIVKSTDEDWYSIALGAGGTLDVTASFTDSDGDIDLELYDGCGGSLLTDSTTNTSNEALSWTNNGGSTDVLLRVFLDSDTRNDYGLNVMIDVPAVLGACCVDETCFQLSAVNCAASAGTYLGDETECSPEVCAPPAGGCCLGEVCIELTEAECATFAGAWQGDGAPCDPNPCTSSGCLGDITGPTPGVPDGNVDSLDFLRLISQWGTPCPGPCDADVTGATPGIPDGNVDALDYLLLISQWGSPGNCP
jgi:hypothetical protein